MVPEDLKSEYSEILMQFLEKHGEKELLAAHDLGRSLVEQGVPVEEIGTLHEDALGALNTTTDRAKIPDNEDWASPVLMEVLMAYGLAFREKVASLESNRKALEESEQRFKDFADCASDWFWEMDADLRLSFLSSSFEQVSEGASPKQFLGKTQQDLGWADTDHDKWLLYTEDLAAHRAIKDFHYLFMTPKGNERHWSISGRPVFNAEGSFTGYRGVGRDVTEKRKAENELEVYRNHLETMVVERTAEIDRQAEQLERALEQEQKNNTLQREFVALVSHEFRTPLAIIDGAAQRIERRKGKLTPEDLKPRVAKIRSAVQRMTDLIESVLSIARLDAGKIEMESQRIDLAALVTEVCQRHQEISKEHAITTDVDSLALPYWGDPKLLDQVFTNLVSNAIKYSPGATEVEVRGRCEHDHAVISVRDHGLGIPENEIPKLFERYFRATTSTGIAGTGIGLNLVKELVEMHDGHICVESAHGKGTTFTVSLPIRTSVEENKDQGRVDEVEKFHEDKGSYAIT